MIVVPCLSTSGKGASSLKLFLLRRFTAESLDFCLPWALLVFGLVVSCLVFTKVLKENGFSLDSPASAILFSLRYPLPWYCAGSESLKPAQHRASTRGRAGCGFSQNICIRRPVTPKRRPCRLQIADRRDHADCADWVLLFSYSCFWI